MLISRRVDRLCLIIHPDHARLAGALCRRWGNERFEAPATGEALQIAPDHHDTGGKSSMRGWRHPYPFSEPSLEVEVPSRWIEDRRYSSAEEAADACHAAIPEAIRLILHPG